MKKLSEREEEIMSLLWSKGPMFVREIVDCLPDPKPHFNTTATFVRGLEKKGWVKHEFLGNSFRYYAVEDVKAYRAQSLKGMISRFFGGSYRNLISALTESEDLTADDLREILSEIERQKK